MMVKVRSLLARNVINLDTRSEVGFAITCLYFMGILGPHQ